MTSRSPTRQLSPVVVQRWNCRECEQGLVTYNCYEMVKDKPIVVRELRAHPGKICRMWLLVRFLLVAAFGRAALGRRRLRRVVSCGGCRATVMVLAEIRGGDKYVGF